MAKIQILSRRSVNRLAKATAEAARTNRTHRLNNSPAKSGGNSRLISAFPLEQPQSDGTISCKQVMPTLSATNAGTAFDVSLFGSKQAVADMDLLGNSYGLSAFVLFTGANTDATRILAQKVSYPLGSDFFVSVQPVFFNAAECEEAAE